MNLIMMIEASLLLQFIEQPMNSHYFTSKSFKYLGNRIQNQSPIPGHATVRSEFDDKIDLLRVPVYEKKKKFQKNNSKKQIVLQQTLYMSEEERKNRKRDSKDHGNGHKPKSYRYKSTHTGRSKYTQTSATFSDLRKEQSPKIDVLKVEKQLHRQTSNFYQRNLNAIKERQEIPARGISQHYDSQSLLRKSSLFLLNFIKRKQKIDEGSGQNPHIAGIPNIASHMKISYSPKRHSKYAPKKRTIISKEKMPTNLEKMLNNLPIEPW